MSAHAQVLRHSIHPMMAPARAVAKAHCCPRCDSESIARSRIRGSLGQVVRRMFGVRPYRCLDCWHRFLGTSQA
jgi:hypothetical protein